MSSGSSGGACLQPLTGEYYEVDEMASLFVVAAVDDATVKEGCGGRKGGELLPGRRGED